tara:strand:- start:49880 stop:51037 length:1158 start_codon:yes stop_codon:yes gene_type:complete
MSRIPLSAPSFNGNEWKYVKECIDTEWVSSAGKYVDIFETNISTYTKSKFAIACVNGTSALHISLKLAGVSPGDEVIVPTLTFIAPINAVNYCGASPVFIDADSHYNIDSEKTINFIKEQTIFKNGFSYNKKTFAKVSAIIPVHVWGNAVWLDELCDLCQERNISIVEDSSESLGTVFIDGINKNKHTGTIGKIGCISFNGNKIITTGGGGIILTNDSDIAEKAKYLTTQAKDDPIRYRHDEVGYNYRLNNIQSALGVAQLEQLPNILKRKKEIFKQYSENIKKVEGVSLAPLPNYAKNNHWLNIIQIDDKIFGKRIDSLIKHLDKFKIQSRPVWRLNHKQKPYRNFQTYKIEKSTKLVKKSLCLPSSQSISNSDIDFIIHKIGD